jgi:hypothetical protein
MQTLNLQGTAPVPPQDQAPTHNRSLVLTSLLEHGALVLPLLLLPLLLSNIGMHNNLSIFRMKWVAHKVDPGLKRRSWTITSAVFFLLGLPLI